MADLPRGKRHRAESSPSSPPTSADPGSGDDRIAIDNIIRQWEQEYSGRLRSICQSLNCRNDAEDVLQEVWFAASRALQAGDPIRNPSEWLPQVTRHKCLDLHRPCHRRLKQLAHPESIADQRDGFKPIEDEELLLLLSLTIDDLPDELRQIMRLRMTGARVSDIAEHLDLPERTVYRRINAAGAIIRPLLARRFRE